MTRDQKIVAARLAGETLASIGARYGLSAERVRMIVKLTICDAQRDDLRRTFPHATERELTDKWVAAYCGNSISHEGR